MTLIVEKSRKRGPGRPRKTFPGVSERVSEVSQKANFTFPSADDDVPPIVERAEKDAAEKSATKEAIAKIPDIFTPEQVIWCFDVYVAILCFAYSILLKTDFKPLQEELEFSLEQKQSMAVPLAKICSKYAPSSWAGMSAEIELITMLSIFTVGSFNRAKKVAVDEAEKARIKNRTAPVAPIAPQVRRMPADAHVPV